MTMRDIKSDTCPIITHVIERNLIPLRQAKAPGGWWVDRIFLVLEYKEKASTVVVNLPAKTKIIYFVEVNGDDGDQKRHHCRSTSEAGF